MQHDVGWRKRGIELLQLPTTAASATKSKCTPPSQGICGYRHANIENVSRRQNHNLMLWHGQTEACHRSCDLEAYRFVDGRQPFPDTFSLVKRSARYQCDR